jgi:hypothetical protein
MNGSVDRREFLKKTAAGAVTLTLAESMGYGPIEVFAAPKPDGIPQRVLGKTGVKVSQLSFGCGSRFMMYKSEEETSEVRSQGGNAQGMGDLCTGNLLELGQ